MSKRSTFFSLIIIYVKDDNPLEADRLHAKNLEFA